MMENIIETKEDLDLPSDSKSDRMDGLEGNNNQKCVSVSNNNSNCKTKPTRRKTKSRYGEIPGIKPGAVFKNRKSSILAGVHIVHSPGIHGNKQNGAYSVCISGGYEDDIDKGDVFIYTGTGGQKNGYGGDHTQVEDQSFNHQGNTWLLTSYISQRPVRVLRGSGLNSKWAPAEGYRYDGLYIVKDAYFEEGISGYNMCKFEFRRLADQPPIPENPRW